MDEYDLARLTDVDFEKLCKDIFEAVLERPLEIFATGADAGIDLRGVDTDTGDVTVVQCKHWMKSDRRKLIQHMKLVERPKVDRLAPARYILATTIELTVDAKEKLSTILRGHIWGVGDLYGRHEIVAELRKRPDIVERHIRLWLSSTAVLGALINHDVHARTRALAGDIDDSLRVYAPNAAYTEALQVLDEHHSCLVTGDPGIGKTTLAHILLADHRAKGFTIVEATAHIDDIHRMWRDDEKQIFFLDDFLGQTTLDDAAARVANQQLGRLLRDVRKSPKKRLVLTCRRYIFAQAKEGNERLADPRLGPYECVINAAAHTRMVRAEIFYNHVYFSAVTATQRVQLADRGVYQRIIGHKNYSPRLLELALLEATELSNNPEADVGAIVLRNLDNPRHLWERMVEHVLDADELALILILYTAGSSAKYDELSVAWRAYLKLHAGADADRRFRRALRRLESTMVRMFDGIGVYLVEFANPSVRDFLDEYLGQYPDALDSLIDSAVYPDQVTTLWWAAANRWPKRNALRTAVNQKSGKVTDAVVRIGAMRHFLGLREGSGHLLWMRLVVELSRASHGQELSEIGSILLDDVDLRLYNAPELVNIAEIFSGSTVIDWRDRAETIAAMAVEQILSDVNDWSDVADASDLIENLESVSRTIADDGAFELNERKVELAEAVVEQWADDSRAVSVDFDELEEVVDFLDSEGGPMPAGFERAVSHLTNRPRQSPRPVLQEMPQPEIGDRVDQMFAKWRNET